MWSQGMLEKVNQIAIKEIRKSPLESAEVKFVLHAGHCIFSMPFQGAEYEKSQV